MMIEKIRASIPPEADEALRVIYFAAMDIGIFAEMTREILVQFRASIGKISLTAVHVAEWDHLDALLRTIDEKADLAIAAHDSCYPEKVRP